MFDIFWGILIFLAFLAAAVTLIGATLFMLVIILRLLGVVL